ncbi:MAG: transporter substrate-binding domain-containing protein [Cyanobacteria bacterium P01_C01_bin.118]
MAFSLPTKAQFSIGVAKNRPELSEKLDNALSDLIKDGTAAQLWEKWIPWKPFPL